MRSTNGEHERVSSPSSNTSGDLSLGLYRRVAALGEFTCQWHPSNQLVASRLSVPVHAIQMILAVEDKRFWIHPGVDPISIGRAALMRLMRKGRRQGGSTIPEQVVKLRTPIARPATLFARSYRAAKSIVLVMRYDRINILTEYLNSIYFGQKCFGICSASRHYFGSEIETLTVSQSFFLADRIALPSKWRSARIANMLQRQLVRDLLGSNIIELPVIYGHSFGSGAENAIQGIVDSLVSR